MSLNGSGTRRLRVESQRAKYREAEPGTDAAFLEAIEEIEFEVVHRQELYDWATQTRSGALNRFSILWPERMPALNRV